MFENIAAFDIGTSSIKIVLVKTGFKDFQVRSFIFENIEALKENLPGAIQESLVRLTEETDFEEYTVLTNLPMEKTVIRDITFPFNDPQKMTEAIPFEAEENIPFALEDVIIDSKPLISEDKNEGRVLLVAARKESIQETLGIFEQVNINPVMMGLESQSLFECYNYFNQVDEETVIQLHIGNTKTIVNIIQNKNLLYTRSISIGTTHIHNAIMEIKKASYFEAISIFEELDLDLTSYENNTRKDNYKNAKLSKTLLKAIFNRANEIVQELISEIILTRKAFALSFNDVDFNRIIISGGGANIHGIGNLLSAEFELPVVSLPFIEDNKEPQVQTQFPMALGMVLSYLNRKDYTINMLKDEFLPDVIATSKKKYALAGTFIIFTVIILIVNIISTSYLKSKSTSEYGEILNKRLKQYFPSIRETSGDPINDAIKKLNEEKKEVQNIEGLIKTNNKLLDILKDMLAHFPAEDSFKLRNIVINETIIKINGQIGSSKAIDEFKNKLIETKMFDDVTYNPNIKKDYVNFSMTIRRKQSRQAKTGKQNLKK